MTIHAPRTHPRLAAVLTAADTLRRRVGVRAAVRMRVVSKGSCWLADRLDPTRPTLRKSFELLAKFAEQENDRCGDLAWKNYELQERIRELEAAS